MSELGKDHEAADAPPAKQEAPDQVGDPLPQREPESQWPSPRDLEHALGSKESWREAVSYALNFTDRHPLGDTGIEDFILAEQMDHLHGAGSDLGAAIEDKVAVIGSMENLEEVRKWIGESTPGSANLEAIEKGGWTVEKNDAWVREVIKEGLPVWLMNDLPKDGLWKPDPDDPGRVQEKITLREFQQFVGAGYRIDGNLLLPPGSPAVESPDRYFVGTKFTSDTAEPVFVHIGHENQGAAVPTRYVGTLNEETPTIPAELFGRYQRLDSASWPVAEDLVRELFGAAKTELRPYLPGMSEAESRQRPDPAWGSEWVINPAQLGFLPWHGRVPDGVSSSGEGLLEAKHYQFFHGEQVNEVPLGSSEGHIWRQLIHDHFAKLEGDDTTWVFSGAPPDKELVRQLHRLDLDFVVMAPRARELKTSEGPTAVWRNHAEWLKKCDSWLDEERTHGR